MRDRSAYILTMFLSLGGGLLAAIISMAGFYLPKGSFLRQLDLAVNWPVVRAVVGLTSFVSPQGDDAGIVLGAPILLASWAVIGLAVGAVVCLAIRVREWRRERRTA